MINGAMAATIPAAHKLGIMAVEAHPGFAAATVPLEGNGNYNTTEHLLADMEVLREHLDVGRWLLYGGSWASTLILAYAQRHPERDVGTILVGVTMTRPQEID